MDFTKLRSFNKAYPLFVEKYELFSLGENASITDKINSVVQALNKVGKLSNDVLKDWNKVMDWVMGEGLDESVDKKVESLIANGRFEEMIQLALTDFNEQLESLEVSLTEIAINVKSFGAKGDGVTDDTVAIQNAINSITKGVVFFPNGTYNISATLTINSGITLKGDGTELKTITNGMDNTFKFTGVDGFSVKGLRFNQNLKGRTSIDISGSKNFVVEDCYFTGYSKDYAYYQTDGGVRLTDTTDGKIINNTWENHGYQYDNSTPNLNRCITIQGTLSDRIIIEGNNFNQVNQAVIIACGEHNVVSGNIFNGVKDNSLYLFIGVKGLNVTGNTFNQKHDEAIVFGGENISITGNVFRNVPNKVFALTDNAKNVVITGNSIINDSATGIAQIFAYRSNTYSIERLVFSNNIIKIPYNPNTFPYFDILGNLTDLIFNGNTIDVATGSSQTIIQFSSTVNGIMKGNIFRGVDGTTSVVTQGASATGSIQFEGNEFFNCRVSTSNTLLIFKHYHFQSGIAYATTFSTNRVMFSQAIPTLGKWKTGDIVYNEVPTAGGYVGWVCIAGDGTGLGTWKGFGTIQA